MHRNVRQVLSVVAALFAGLGLFGQSAEVPNRTAAPTAGGDRGMIVERATRRAVLNNARAAAAARTKAALAAKGGKVNPASLGVNPATRNTALAGKVLGPEGALAVPGPGFQLAQPDYMFGTASNWHNTKPIHKFVDTLPGLGVANKNNLGNFIPVAQPDTTTYSGSDYYQLGIVEYTQVLHSELNPTRLRGYKDIGPKAENTANGVNSSNYLGPVIIAKRNRPVRVKVTNQLPTGTAGDLFIPVDTTMMGAGYGPLGNRATGTKLYTQNRAELHLHGGLNPWISDGTPHQWFTPASETTSYPKGVAFQNVPDMLAGTAGDGIGTYFYTNQQSGRFLFYHDHTFGLTRLNVYAGEAAGYLIVDPVDDKLINAGILPNNGGGVYNYGIPLIIQDKTFVDTATLGTVGVAGGTDPTWDVAKYGGDGSLWYPHVYMVNQNPADLSGSNAMGRWDYGPWFWPPLTAAAGLVHGAEPVVGDPNGTEIPGTPNPSLVPEAFLDTPVVNGTAYPKITVQPQAYRFRVLNASNDRFWNLSFFQADATGTEVTMVPSAPNATWPATWPTDGRDGGVPDPATAGPSWIQIGTESGFIPAPVVIAPQPVSYNYNRRDIVVLNVADKGLFLGAAERADVVVDFSAFAGKKLILYNDAPSPVPAFDPRLDYYTGAPDQRDSGGANTTLAGFGPNTRTIMLFEVANVAPAAPFNLAALEAAFTSTSAGNGAFAEAQHPPIVPSSVFNKAYNKSFTDEYVRIQDQQFRRPYASMENGDPVQPTLEPKAIQELFELDYGRMNATLGVEMPFTNFTIQTTIPLGYSDPATETLIDGTTQFWKITHNGVDTHPVHFHLFDVQVVNRVGWDGAVRFPDANEFGWKETVKMSPLEDVIVAFRPLSPRLPFSLPNSLRSPNVVTAASANIVVTNPLDGNPLTIANSTVDYGWEYVWHCHILGHEENDFMRPMILNVARTAPKAPSALTATSINANRLDLAWKDNSTDETGFSLQRRAGGSTDPWVQVGAVVPNVRSYSDFTVVNGSKYDYRVVAYNQAGDSAPSNIATLGVATVSVTGTATKAGAPVQDILISISNGQTALTDASGVYTFSVPVGFTGTATPVTSGYVYTPAARTYTNLRANQTSQDFTAATAITVSGRVTAGATALASATVTFSTGETATTDANGNYSRVVLSPYTGSFTASKTGYYITPFPIVLTGATTDLPGQNFSAVAGFSVAGRLTTNGTTGIAGVAVAFSGGSTIVTDATGNYSVMVPSRYSGAITPSKAGYLFTPTSITLNRIAANTTGQNFTGRAIWPVTGTVTSGATPLAGVTVTFSGTGGGTATTSAAGTYTFNAPGGWSGTITPAMRGTIFLPASVTVANLAAARTQNFSTAQTIAGTTRLASNNSNVNGVTLTYTGTAGGAAFNGSVTSSATGTFTITVPTGWVGTVTAASTGRTWSTTTVMPMTVNANVAALAFRGI